MPGPFWLGCCCSGPVTPPAGCCCRNGFADPSIGSWLECIQAGGVWHDGVSCDEIDCGGGGGGGCSGGCNLILPATGQVTNWWEILSAQYNRTSGAWQVVARTLQDGAYSSGQLYSVGGANAQITSHVPPPTFGFGLPYPADVTVTIQGTSTPPVAANCGSWEFGLLTFAVVFLPFAFTTEPC